MKQENIRLCQFLNLEMVIHCSYYNDYIHFSGLGAQEVLHAMESGEYDVTEENMADTLRAIRTFQQEFDYLELLTKDGKNPDLIPLKEAAEAEKAETETAEGEEAPEAEEQ